MPRLRTTSTFRTTVVALGDRIANFGHANTWGRRVTTGYHVNPAWR